jgi:hypothetical protein
MVETMTDLSHSLVNTAPNVQPVRMPTVNIALPDGNVDPRDCTRFPNSPFCGGKLINLVPLGFSIFFTQDPCNLTLNVSPIIAAISLPPTQITLHSATDECNPPPPPPPVVNEQPSYVPPPQGNSGIYIAVSSGSVSQSITYIQTPEQNISTSVSWDVSFLDLRYPLHINQTIGVPFEGYIDVSDSGNVACYFKNNALNPLYTSQEQAEFQWYPAYIKPSPSVANIVQGLQDLPQIVFFINGFENALLFAQQYKNLDNKNIYPRVSGNGGDLYYGIYQSSTKQTWTIFEYFGNNKPWYPPPPPPNYNNKKNMCTCDSTNSDQLLRLILANIGTIPQNVPATFLTKNSVQPTAQVTINSLTDFMAWQATRLDEVLGEFEIRVQVSHPDIKNKKTVTDTITLPNLAEAVAELFTVITDMATSVQIILNITNRMIIEVGTLKTSEFRNYNAVLSIIDYLGFNYTQSVDNVPLLHTPGATNFVDLLQEFQQNTDYIKYEDSNTLTSALQSLLQAAAIIRAVHYRKLPDDNTNMVETLKRDLSMMLDNRGDLQSMVNNFVKGLEGNGESGGNVA